MEEGVYSRCKWVFFERYSLQNKFPNIRGNFEKIIYYVYQTPRAVDFPLPF